MNVLRLVSSDSSADAPVVADVCLALVVGEPQCADDVSFLTKRALMAIAQDPEATAPFWRVVMGSGEMIAAYPGDVTQQALHLRSEGVTIADKAGRNRVVNLMDSLAVL